MALKQQGDLGDLYLMSDGQVVALSSSALKAISQLEEQGGQVVDDDLGLSKLAQQVSEDEQMRLQDEEAEDAAQLELEQLAVAQLSQLASAGGAHLEQFAAVSDAGLAQLTNEGPADLPLDEGKLTQITLTAGNKSQLKFEPSGQLDSVEFQLSDVGGPSTTATVVPAHPEEQQALYVAGQRINVGQVPVKMEMGSGDLMCLDDFMDIITTFKCKGCDYKSHEKEQLLKHVKENHLVEMSPEKPSREEEDEDEEEEEELREVDADPEQSVDGISIVVDNNEEDPNKKVTVTKDVVELRKNTQYQIFLQNENREMFVCGTCSACFDSSEQCGQHIKEGICTQEEEEEGGDDYHQENSKHLPTVETEYSQIINIQPRMKPSVHDERKRAKLELEADFEKRKITCSLKGCNFKFKHEEQLKYHIACHQEETHDFKCLECEQTFERWRHLAQHLWRQHALDCDMLLCSHCRDYRTMSLTVLEQHMKTHLNRKEYSCDVCHKRFNQVTQLKNHTVVHMDKISDLPCWARPKECDICRKLFSDSKSLKKHVQAVHSRLKPYICQICGHQAARKAMLQMHVRQHTGEKPYHCDECEYRTGDHNSLRRHKKRHTGDKPYKCPYCKYASIQSSCLKSHLKSKHADLEAERKKAEEAGGRQVDMPMMDGRQEVLDYLVAVADQGDPLMPMQESAGLGDQS